MTAEELSSFCDPGFGSSFGLLTGLHRGILAATCPADACTSR